MEEIGKNGKAKKRNTVDWSGGRSYTQKLTTRARKSVKYGTRFSVDRRRRRQRQRRRQRRRRRRRRRGQGRGEWCDLFFKILLFAIYFLRFKAHLRCALFGGRF